MTVKISQDNKGFTLIELLVVIAIIGLLASVVFASLNSARVKSRDARRISDLKQIQTALELYYDDHGYYPAPPCGWDCNGYTRSNIASWDTLATELEPYIASLPEDPLNTGGYPWNTGNYTYSYGNVGRNTRRIQYDLTAQLEDPNHPQRCAEKQWHFYFTRAAWCGSYSDQIYEGSIN
ncbi:type II secretion system protein [Patescibacteria group bacterium]